MSKYIKFFAMALRHIKKYLSTVNISTKWIAKGDHARSSKDWVNAAKFYRNALGKNPNLPDIWIQLGHAYKESGDLSSSIGAYNEAVRTRPNFSDPYIFLAHIYKGMSLYELAIESFIRGIFYGNSTNEEAGELAALLIDYKSREGHQEFFSEIWSILQKIPESDSRMIEDIRGLCALEREKKTISEENLKNCLVFDVSDLMSYFKVARLPTGIQRVQIEIVEECGELGYDSPVKLCCFVQGRDEWLELPLERIKDLTKLSTQGGGVDDAEWITALISLNLMIRLAGEIDFPAGASLVNLGTSWWLQNYFLYIRKAKIDKGIKYIPFIHDMIPIMRPEYCTTELTQDFISWAIGVFDHADHYLCNSNATKRDLIAVASFLGYNLEESNVSVVPLDADFGEKNLPPLPVSDLRKWGLQPNSFILFVSTIEGRKGHLVAFEAWLQLISEHGESAVPTLVCVGNRGWLNDRIYQMLETNPFLVKKVKMLSRLSDLELALLYDNCLFTLYPSLYEGWGLPVTESLCHNKIPVLSNSSSLPEAGGDFALYAEAGSVESLADTIKRLLFNFQFRLELENHIIEKFRPRSWRAIAEQIIEEVNRFSHSQLYISPKTPLPPMVKINKWYPLTRSRATRIWPGIGTGEQFRDGLGWYWPEDRGCRVRPEGGGISFRLEELRPQLRLFIELLGDENADSRWSISAGDFLITGRLARMENKWVSIDLSAFSDPALRLIFGVVPADDGIVITYFVRSFIVVDAEGGRGCFDFLQAVALNQLDQLSAFKAGREYLSISTGPRNTSSIISIEMERFYALTQRNAQKFWRMVENVGDLAIHPDWYWPEARGCRVRVQGGQLRFKVKDSPSSFVLFVELVGDESNRSRWRIDVQGQSFTGELELNERKWLAVEIGSTKSPIVISFLPQFDRGGAISTFFVRGIYCHADGNERGALSLISDVILNNVSY